MKKNGFLIISLQLTSISSGVFAELYNLKLI